MRLILQACGSCRPAVPGRPGRARTLRNRKGRALLAHFSVSSHQPAPPPNHQKGAIDGWLGGGAGRTRGSTQGENGLAAQPNAARRPGARP